MLLLPTTVAAFIDESQGWTTNRRPDGYLPGTFGEVDADSGGKDKHSSVLPFALGDGRQTACTSGCSNPDPDPDPDPDGDPDGGCTSDCDGKDPVDDGDPGDPGEGATAKSGEAKKKLEEDQKKQEEAEQDAKDKGKPAPRPPPPPPPPPKPVMTSAGAVGAVCHEWTNIVEVMAGAPSYVGGPRLGAAPQWRSGGGYTSRIVVQTQMRMIVLDRDRDRINTATDVDGVGGVDGRDPLPVIRRQAPVEAQLGQPDYGRPRDPYPYGDRPWYTHDDGKQPMAGHTWPVQADGGTDWIGGDDGSQFARYNVGTDRHSYRPNLVLWLRAWVDLGADGGQTQVKHSDGTSLYGGEAVGGQVRSRGIAYGPGGNSGWTAWNESPVGGTICEIDRTKNPVAG